MREVDVQLEQTLSQSPGARPGVAAGATPEAQGDTLLGGVDTVALRNVIHSRVFGQVVDPARIGRFPILRRVGQGGMGVVYAAYDNELDRKVAIKLLRPGAREDAEGLRARLLREAKALARLTDPGIVGVYEVGEHDEQVYVAMEFVEGRTLRQWAEEHQGGTAELLALYLQAARGLAAAHDAGIVHRDFKPDNAIVGQDGRVRVLDFGLATAPGSPSDETPPEHADAGRQVLARLTMTGALLGTPAYMAPEQLAGATADARSDQFSFAVALFEALYGARPFSGATIGEIAAAMAAGRITVPSGKRVPARVARVLRRALQRERDARFSDMRQLVAALDARPARRLAWLGSTALGVLGLGLAAQQQSERAREQARARSLEATAADLEVTASTERGRADDAELALQQRADALTMAEAKFVMQRDPTRAVALLANLSEDAVQWQGEARTLATEAAAAGIAERVVDVPEGYGAVRVSTRERVALMDAESRAHALWNPASNVVTPLVLGDHTGFAELDDDASHAVIGSSRGVDVLDIDSGARRHFAEGACLIPLLARGGRFAVIDCTTDVTRTWLLDLERGEARVVSTHGPSLLLGVATDGSAIAWSFDDERYRYLAVSDTSREPIAAARSHGRSLALSDDARWVAEQQKNHVQLADLRERNVYRVPLGAQPTAAAFTADGKRVALGTNDGGVVLVELGTLAVRELDGRHADRVAQLAWSADGKTLDSAAAGGEIGVWDVDSGRMHARLRGLAGRVGMRRIDDQHIIASSSEQLRMWKVSGVGPIDTDVVAHDEQAGMRAVVRSDGRIELGPIGGELIEIGRHPGAERCALAPGGERVATRSPDWLRMHDDDGTLLVDERIPSERVAMPAFSQDGRWLSWVAEPGAVALEVTTARRIVAAPAPPTELRHQAFIDANTWGILELRYDETSVGIMRRYDLATGMELPALPMPVSPVFGVESTVDGALWLAGMDELLRWTPGTGVVERDPMWKIAARELDASPDNERLLVSTLGRPSQLLDLAHGDQRITGLGPQNGDRDIRSEHNVNRQPIIRDDGTALEIRDGRVFAERVDVPRDPAALRAWVSAATPLRVAPGAIDEQQR